MGFPVKPSENTPQVPSSEAFICLIGIGAGQASCSEGYNLVLAVIYLVNISADFLGSVLVDVFFLVHNITLVQKIGHLH